MKKLLALILSVSMVFTIGTSVMAYPDVEAGTYVSEAVTVLSDLNILNGFEDGNFKPEETVTRAQMAKIICEVLNYNQMGSNKTVFSDVEPKHWASGYISSVYNLGIINGYGNDMFGPEDTVTYEQAVKMLVCTLGYEPMAADMGGWPSGYLAVATTIGLTKNVNSSNRGNIAILVYNALNTPVMERTSFGSETRYEILDGTNRKEYKTLLTKRDIYIATGLVGEVDIDTIEFTITKDSKDNEFEKSEDTIDFVIGDSDIADYMYQTVDVYVEKTDDDEYTVLAVKSEKASDILTIASEDIYDIDGDKVEYYVGSKIKKLTVDEDIIVKNNKSEGELEDILGLDDAEIKFIDNDDDKEYDVIVITAYTSERLEMVDADRDRMIIDGRTVTFEFDNKEKTYIFLDEKGNDIELADFEKDDVIAYIHDGDNVKNADYIKIIRLSNSTVEGVVKSVNDRDNTISIDGTKYEVADSCWELVNEPGTEGVFYIGLSGKIVYFDGSSVSANYGYILAVGVNDNGFEETMQIKMLTTDGVDIYDMSDKAADMCADIFGDNIDNIIWNDSKINTVYAKRFVKYSINKAGEISKISNVTNSVDAFTDAEYNADTEIIDGKFIDKNTVVFVIDDGDDSEVYATNMNYFVDEGTYTGATYVNDDGDTKVVFVIDSDTAYSSEMGFAIVTGVSETVDEDNDTIYVVDYVQNEVEGTVYFEEDVDFEIGTVFAFNISADNYVNKHIVIGTIDDNDDFVAEADSDDITDAFGDKVEVVFGYIENEERKTNSKGEVITIDGDKYVITNATNKYTYVDARNKTKIETEDFLAGDAYYADEDGMTPVMVKIVDGVVVDIYTISSRK